MRRESLIKRFIIDYFYPFRRKEFKPAVVDQLLKSLLSKPPGSQGSKRRRTRTGRNNDFIDGDTEDEEAEDDPAAEMFDDVRNSQAKSSSEDVEDPGSPISSVISFDEIFSMPKFDE